MNYKYKFSKLEYSDGDKDLIIIMEERYQMIAQFLMSDIQGSDPGYVFEAIDKVLSGESDYEELNGNVCGVEIHKDKTQVYDNLAEDGMGNWCEVDTKDLRELVDIWCKEVKKFKEQHK
ncbi:hypothetical protein [uncultured Clostridium sp.]|uniref:hypothetical protein n=1 Tax=uncultured Clostridium sp. TaxID=59620 RepID=UPI0025E6AA75|nr:hypothetical protein [uncultured Clostridium sp.]